MVTTPLILLAVLTVVLLFWYGSLRMREYVVRRCQNLCQASGLQLLDETVALSSLSLRRDRHGRLRLHRRYQFAVSENGADRYPGYILLTGWQIDAVHIEGPAGTTILHENATLRLH